MGGVAVGTCRAWWDWGCGCSAVQRRAQDHAFFLGCTQAYFYFLLFFFCSPVLAIKAPFDEESVLGW